MSGYKANQEEVRERAKYSKEHSLGIFFIISVMSLFLSLFALNDNQSLLNVFISIKHNNFYTILVFIISISLFYWWKKKKKELDLFFFQPVSIFNGIEYPDDGLKILSHKNRDILSIFSFNAYDLKRDDSKTDNIVKLFRDNTLDTITRKAPRKVKSYKNKYGDSPTPAQYEMFTDLFLATEGILRGYKQLKTKVIPAPIYIDKKSKEVVFRNSEVYNGQDKLYFSYTMIEDTLKVMTHLFYKYASKQFELKQSTRLYRNYPDIFKSKNDLEKSVDIFKIVYLRKLLSNYGSMPSGWYVIRIEDYDTRAIISAVDRPMIPLITPQNDGTSVAFSSDTWASAWLYMYWSFMKTQQIEKIENHINWAFNTTKDINEIKMYEMAQNLKKGK